MTPTPLPRTPGLTRHARERCAEMGISTKVAKRIVRYGEVAYPGTPSEHGPSMVVLWSGDPHYAVVATADRSLVLTVLFNTPEYYERAGTTFRPVGPLAAAGKE